MENVIFCSDGRGSLDGSENSENVAVSSNQKSFFNPKTNSELNIFISKEEFRASPCDKSKVTKENIAYKNFKIEGLFLSKKRILKGNWICKDTYFSVSLHPEFQNLVRFQWFISGSKNVYKTVENSNSSVQKVDDAANNILDDILIMTILVEELIVARDIFSKCLIYLPQDFWVSS